jgi:hypothetical protein
MLLLFPKNNSNDAAHRLMSIYQDVCRFLTLRGSTSSKPYGVLAKEARINSAPLAYPPIVTPAISIHTAIIGILTLECRSLMRHLPAYLLSNHCSRKQPEQHTVVLPHTTPKDLERDDAWQ